MPGRLIVAVQMTPSGEFLDVQVREHPSDVIVEFIEEIIPYDTDDDEDS